MPVSAGLLVASTFALTGLWLLVLRLGGNRQAPWGAGLGMAIVFLPMALFLGSILFRMVRALVPGLEPGIAFVRHIVGGIADALTGAPAIAAARAAAIETAHDMARSLARDGSIPTVETHDEGAGFDVHLDGELAHFDATRVGRRRVRVRWTLGLQGADVRFAANGIADRSTRVVAAPDLARTVFDAPTLAALAGTAGPWRVFTTRAGLSLERTVRVGASPSIDGAALAAAGVALQRRILAHLAEASMPGAARGAFRAAVRVEPVDPQATDASPADEAAAEHARGDGSRGGRAW